MKPDKREKAPAEGALLFETLRIEDGVICHADYHNKRMNRSRAELLGAEKPLDLRDSINPPPRGLLRCRVSYGETFHSVEFFPYSMRVFKVFRIVESALVYNHKFADRGAIDNLFQSRGDADDIIIVRHGRLTDTSIANIAFHDGTRWITPDNPLLRGTSRQRHIDSGLLTEAAITAGDLPRFTRMALLNAMMDFHVIDNPRFIL